MDSFCKSKPTVVSGKGALARFLLGDHISFVEAARLESPQI